LGKLSIPQHIVIGDNRDDTEHAFDHLLSKRTGGRILMLASTLPGTDIDWLTELLASYNGALEMMHIDKGNSKTVQRVAENIKRHRAMMCIGAGGGKVLDVAKYASFLSKIPFVAYPTLLSHDGIASPVAVIPEGEHWSESRMAESPYSVIVDLQTVSEAPLHSTLSGISDLTANLFATLDAERFRDEHEGAYASLATALARSASQLVFPGFSKLALQTLSAKQVKPLAWGLVLSGIAMAISGDSRPASGAEHKISHAIDYLFRLPVTHGFTVSVGNVVSAFLHEAYEKEIMRFNKALGLPVLGEDIGLGDEDFAKAILYAGKVRPERRTILEEKALTEKKILKLLERIRAEKGSAPPTP
jgi:glycerol-1-phosphate dehydrogenase [NAD(P)+]